MRSDTKNWILMANCDLETARYMLSAGRHLYVIFMCHLALEKTQKAHVTEVTDSIPAKSHDLIYLVKKAQLQLPQKYLEFIGKINNASVLTRYPEDLQKMLREYPEPIVRGYLQQTK